MVDRDERKPRRGPGKPALRRMVRIIRDGWLIAGLALVLFVALELAYRAQSRIRAALRNGTDRSAVVHPHAGEPWFGADMPGDAESARFDPYRLRWASGSSSRYVNVDSAGLRVTPQPVVTEPALRVFTFGGSTMWGWPHIDSLTIPAFMVRALGSVHPAVRIDNYAQPGYTLTQNLITLLLEIRRGNVPDVAVFLDGGNEMASAWGTGRAGSILNEAMSAEAFELGRRTFWQEVRGLPRHSMLLRRLHVAFGRPAAHAPARPGPGLCDDIAGHYAILVKEISALGTSFGFDVLALWQPLLATTAKPLTPYERSVQASDPYNELVRRCSALAMGLLAADSAPAYRSLGGLFDSDTATMYLDAWGHLTVQGNERVADAIVGFLVPILDGRVAR